MQECIMAEAPDSRQGDPNVLRYTSDSYGNQFFKNLRQLQGDASLCDVTLQVENQTFPAHRVVLASGSSYFRAMFLGGLAEHQKDEVHIGGVSAKIFDNILHFLYSGEVCISEENCEDLIAAADMLSVTGVVHGCSQFMKEKLQPENCIGIFEFADALSCIELKKDAEAYIHSHFLKVCTEEEYFNLSKDTVTNLLHSEHLRIENEFQVFRAAMNWILHDLTSRRKHVFEVMAAIRFPIISDKQMDSYLDAMEDISLKVALTKILKDFKCDKKCNVDSRLIKMKPFLTQPRKCARKNIYVVGGYSRRKGGRWSDAQTLSIVERFDTFHQQWYSLPSIHHARSGHGVATVNGQVCVVGGENDSLIYDTVETYDPVSHEWTMLPGMTTPRCGLGVCTLENCLFALGGWVGSELGRTVEKYDPNENKWKIVGRLKTLRFAMGVTGYQGLIYVIGGMSDLGTEMDEAESYNPVTKEWIDLGNMHTKRAYVGVAAIDGYIYAVGGWNEHIGALNTVERYSLEKCKWQEVAPMSAKRAAASVAVVNDLLYVIGGRSFTDEFTAPSTLDTMECYDPGTNSWIDVGYMPISRCEAGAVVL